MAIHVRLHEGNIRQLITSPAEQIPRTIAAYTRRTANRARTNAPVDTGQLRASVQTSVTTDGLRVVGRVWTPLEHGLWQELGTGIYAGKGPIRPKRGQYLVFPAKRMGPPRRGGRGGKALVFAKEVKGTPPTHWLSNALDETVPWPIHRLVT